MAEGRLNPKQVEIVSDFLTTVNLIRARHDHQSYKVKDALRFLLPRGFNLDQAIKSYEEYEKLISVYGKKDGGLATFKFTGSVDDGGSPILLLECSDNELKKEKDKVLFTLLQVLHCLPGNVESCEQSIVVIISMRGLSQFPALLKDLLIVLLDVYPVLVKTIYIIKNPHLEEVYKKFIFSFLSSASNKKVLLVSETDIGNFVPLSSLPESLGGSHMNSQLDWMDMCLGPIPTSQSDHVISPDDDQMFEAFLASKGLSGYKTSGVHPVATLPKSKMAQVSRNGYINDLREVFEPRQFGPGGEQRRVTLPNSELQLSSRTNGTDIQQMKEEKAPTIPPKLRKGSSPAVVKASDNTSQNLTAYLDILSNLDNMPPDQPLADIDSKGSRQDGTDEEVKPVLPPKQSRVKTAVQNYIASTLTRKKNRWQATDDAFKGDKLMSIDELDAYIQQNGKRGMSWDYYCLREEPPNGTFEKFKNPLNTPKNRYKDVGCYDHSRVQLQRLEGVEGLDYIHANFVDGYRRPRAFIVTQGPLDNTVSDFWRMVWEQQCYVIVMITKCVELGRIKCAQYWPQIGAVRKYDDITVENLISDDKRSYVLRVFSLKKDGKEHVIHHFQFTAWPDYGVPLSGQSVIDLIKEVRQKQSEATQHITKMGRPLEECPPVIVHCSAGIGRSGTYCSLDYCMLQYDELKKVNIMGTIRMLRSQRACSIQTEDQYEFCYKAIMEYSKSDEISQH